MKIFDYLNLQHSRGSDNAYFFTGPIVPGADSSIIPKLDRYESSIQCSTTTFSKAAVPNTHGIVPYALITYKVQYQISAQYIFNTLPVNNL